MAAQDVQLTRQEIDDLAEAFPAGVAVGARSSAGGMASLDSDGHGQKPA